jgi:anti-anti-sigma regulatory factor
MLLVTSNREKQLLYLSYIGQVRIGDLARHQSDVAALMAELSPDFRMLVNLSELETMDLNCMTELGSLMELIDRSGVGLIVRVIPDPAKDIGFNILSIFHYPHRPKIATCNNMIEAGKLLGI